jgi:hypothetical protein
MVYVFSWFMLKYPIPKEKRIKLARLYYELCATPGMPGYLLSTWADGVGVLIRSKKKLCIDDMRLPWKPIYELLKNDLFLSRRQFEIRYDTVCIFLRSDDLLRFSNSICEAKPRTTWGTLQKCPVDFITQQQSTKCWNISFLNSLELHLMQVRSSRP